MKKTLYTLCVDDYAPEITRITFPLLRHYARKIGAAFEVIDIRRFPDWPVTYEKFQIYERAERNGDDWSIYLDADTLVHPETPDWTQYLPMDTVAHNGCDFAGVRWRGNKYFQRDGRNIGSCNWNTTASRLCRDLWRPLDPECTPASVVDEIFPTVAEMNSGLIDPQHLIDDYLCSLNIARYGLKFTTLIEVQKRLGFDPAAVGFYHHDYALNVAQKVRAMTGVLCDVWKLPAMAL